LPSLPLGTLELWQWREFEERPGGEVVCSRYCRNREENCEENDASAVIGKDFRSDFLDWGRGTMKRLWNQCGTEASCDVFIF